MQTTTERDSHYNNLEQMSLAEILQNINKEDTSVPLAVAKALPQIEALAAVITARMKQGGRLFYIGAGTSGRLGVVDASECPPTFGISDDIVIGIMAGGDQAFRQAVEFSEDNKEQAWKDLQAFKINPSDSVIGIAA